MSVREGVIPTALGSAVTATGYIMRRQGTKTAIADTVLGFGLGHIVLGVIDIVQHR